MARFCTLTELVLVMKGLMNSSSSLAANPQVWPMFGVLMLEASLIIWFLLVREISSRLSSKHLARFAVLISSGLAISVLVGRHYTLLIIKRRGTYSLR